MHPVTKQPAGAVVLGLSWASPLSLGRPTSGAAATAAAAGLSSGAPSAGGLGAFGGVGAGRGRGTAPPLGGSSMPGTLSGNVAGQGLDTGLAGFEGGELREVPAQAHPPTHIPVPAGFAGFSPPPRPVQLQHQTGGIAMQPGPGGVGSYGNGSVGGITLQPGTGGVGPYGSSSAGSMGGVGGVPFGGVRRPSVGPRGLPPGVTSQGLSLFDQENLQARQLMEEQAHAQQRLQQQQQQRGMPSGMIGSTGSAAAQQPRGAYGASLQGGAGSGSYQPQPALAGLSAQPPVVKPFSNLGVGQQALGMGQQSLEVGQQPPLPLQQQPQQLHRGLQQQPLTPAFGEQGGGRGGVSNLGGAPAAIPRVPSNRFGGQGTTSGLGLVEPQLGGGAPGGGYGLGLVPQQLQPATPSGAQEYGLSSEMSSPDPSATPGGGTGSVRLLPNVPPPRSGDGAGRYASLGGGGLSDSVSLYSATPAPAQRPFYRGPL
ncbi:hypothetical protein DUNSADRAFT_14171, partial [Dunaliella salina]